LRHFTARSFWDAYENLPRKLQQLADKNFALLKDNPQHPSLHFKKVGRYWSARIGIHHRAVATEAPDGFLWISILSHDDYERVI
jgi:hypothetical protein